MWPLDFSSFFLEACHETALCSLALSRDGLRVLAAAAAPSPALGLVDVPSHGGLGWGRGCGVVGWGGGLSLVHTMLALLLLLLLLLYICAVLSA